MFLHKSEGCTNPRFGIVDRKPNPGFQYPGTLRDIEAKLPRIPTTWPMVEVKSQLEVGTGEVNLTVVPTFLSVIRRVVNLTQLRVGGGAATAAAIRLDGFSNGAGVAAVAGVSGLIGDIRSLSSQSVSAQMPSPSASPMPGQVGVPVQIAIAVNLVIIGIGVSIIAGCTVIASTEPGSRHWAA